MNFSRQEAARVSASRKRRDLLNTTASKHIDGAGAVFLMAGVLFFCSLSNTIFPALAAADEQRTGASPGVGQNNSQKAADLLRSARTAMNENNFSAAESNIAQAETLNVEYSAFNLTGDTPKKLRKELERKRNAAMPAKPSQFFSPSADKRKNVPATDPFANRLPNAAGAPGVANAYSPLPKVDAGNNSRAGIPLQGQPSPIEGSYPSTSMNPPNAPLNTLQFGTNSADSAQAGVAVAMGGPTGKTRNDLLLAARKSLAVGDLRRAYDLTVQAKSQNIQYGPLDDTPSKVEEAIKKTHDLNSASLDKNSEAYRRGYARNLTEQGEAMLRYGEFDEAEKLAGLAGSQPISYGPFESKPQDLMNRISAARRSGGAAMPSNEMQRPNEFAPIAGTTPATRQMGSELIRQAREALAVNQIDRAESLARRAEQLRIPETSFAQDEDRPSWVLSTIQEVRQQRPGVMQASHNEVVQANGMADNRMANNAIYNPMNDATRNMQVQGTNGAIPAPPRPLGPRVAEPMGQPEAIPTPGGNSSPMLEDAANRQQLMARQAAAELAHVEANARAMVATNPQQAIEMIEQAKQKIEGNAGLEPGTRDILLRRADRSIGEYKQYFDQNRPQIERAQRNQRIRDEVAKHDNMNLDNQDKIAQMVDEYNRLIDEQRYEEAQVTAKKAAELFPKEPVVQQMVVMSKFIYRVKSNEWLKDAKEKAIVDEWHNVDIASIPGNSNNPYVMPDAKTWDKITRLRGDAQARRDKANMTEREIEIQKKLRTPIMVSFKDMPLSEVVKTLAQYADVNIFLDPKGLEEEGVAADTPITIEVKKEIMLQSVLRLILTPKHLSYVVKNEVLNITSERMKDGELVKKVYSVADLVIPIPNFVPIPMGFDAAYRNAMDAVGYGGGAAGFSPTNSPLAVVADSSGKGQRGLVNPKLMAQLANSSGMGGGRAPGGAPGPIGFGPGGLGGGTQADFDSLIDLITKTIKPTTWDEVGGPGSIQPFDTNLSIVVSQTQEVHEEIVDLLGQLRRMQDLQVTIEVRFITLNDTFFERIGVDFDFDIHDYNWGKTNVGFGSANNAAAMAPGVQTEPARNTVLSTRDKNATVGLSSNVSTDNAASAFSSNLDIPFRQGSYGLAIPQFGGFDPTAGATMGFAILSDIEAYFFVNAASGDKRSNVLQAPKVTLFNGQQAFVADQSQTPFVTSVIPVVGDFAAAQQPVIVVLSEGTFMTVQAVVSQDRRFVRLTVVPFFSKIGAVNTFTFTGSNSTSLDTTRKGNQTNPTDATQQSNIASSSSSGTTVQLPTFSYVSVTTTVSVPDGGTVLLGGIKRLSEGRNEFGVPMLSDLPYINRLFKNVAVGRETQSLMMMVTPRIIIQEEEEGKLGISTGP
jgi:general secretion pathway protein D